MASNKGSDFERDMCKELSLWISKGKRVDVFMRNRVRVTEFTPERERQLGDLTTNDIKGIYFTSMFVVECKTGYSKTKKGSRTKNIPWDLLDIIDGVKDKQDNKTLLQFWDQVESDAKLCHKKPILIFKRDFHVPCACVNRDTYNMLSDYVGTNYYPFIELHIKEEVLKIWRLEHFLKWFNPEPIELMYKEGGKRKDSY